MAVRGVQPIKIKKVECLFFNGCFRGYFDELKVEHLLAV